MAILNGINHASVARLKKTIEIVKNDPLYKDLIGLRSMVSSNDDYSQYRLNLKSSSMPCIPYMYFNLT
jgi:hypothetical protein